MTSLRSMVRVDLYVRLRTLSLIAFTASLEGTV